ncbi:MAG: hypothetical protein A3C49_01625 [Candidatus Doudnabacteria bacterium RIFCSPHIGHO2_02_FULL_42_25]|uniref:Uncharacterized protein n=1 Tax=Candidatus Doudnabacteria bacterium RIFCSPHIGHO2_01_FULL_41_86 TaxID=1817821 RepID=A0A1F5N9A8_9BACT|nr:MAG: hypothetical protein A2717_01225 [Candidatus Doudnabacteria bacterium RIFCSPHIGHO2_01_FULL_41_86]OGE74847.1 MAG: hypothetical protein A3K07_02800 [Candidatus Doudnabacteria bacterium RIFCSPHIGHO2_01_43_10]OGE85191.1 MAG: hypothetical protein A3E28_00790 [Candidatus Doudnabacteria bacterium RIFCSPHIGHO2_12_FULL_42_22]OGE86729.1 MAG: hypothetical protein A3C49_01625 [Candidatus Doudnabacteria bacterium RIFCSPHIGHO2_02_FULL_42_25]OGE92327.1 MAG: hypothetical protein A2895_01780 [Candidatus
MAEKLPFKRPDSELSPEAIEAMKKQQETAAEFANVKEKEGAGVSRGWSTEAEMQRLKDDVDSNALKVEPKFEQVKKVKSPDEDVIDKMIAELEAAKTSDEKNVVLTSWMQGVTTGKFTPNQAMEARARIDEIGKGEIPKAA